MARDVPGALAEAGDYSMRMHYRIWAKPGKRLEHRIHGGVIFPACTEPFHPL